jgi:FKBP-type peptidyl-prolyl cis-trans isomerase
MVRGLLLLCMGMMCAACSGPQDGRFSSMVTGVKYFDEKVGAGEEAVKGASLTMHYTGWLYEGDKKGKKFDSSRGGSPFSFRFGAGEVIEGWDEGIKGMKVGGVRHLIIAPERGYGAGGAPPDIPPNATLYFEVELLRAR